MDKNVEDVAGLFTSEEEDPDYLEPDKFRLDEELVRQPKLFRSEAVELAKARRDYAVAKSYLDLVEAELGKKIRERPLEYKVEKVTEEGVKTTVKLQKSYQAALQQVINAKYRQDLLEGTVEALRQRKGAVEKLVDLFLADYFAEVRTPKGKSEEFGKLKRDAAFGRRGRKPDKE